jgi:hypothetical protein
MAVLKYTRSDIQVLADRLSNRAGTLTVRDAQLAADLAAAGKLLRYMLDSGFPVTSCRFRPIADSHSDAWRTAFR